MKGKKAAILARILAALLVVCMLFTGNMSTVRAAEKPSDIADKYEVGGNTYYKVDSTKFSTSSKAFFEDLLNTASSEIGDKSAAEHWDTIGQKVWDKKSKMYSSSDANLKGLMASVLGGETMDEQMGYAFKTDLTAADSPKLAEDMILSQLSEEADVVMPSSWRDPLASLQESVGLLQSETTGGPALFIAGCSTVALSPITSVAYAIVFSDFKVNPLIPEDKNGNYVTTTVKDVTSEGEAQASAVKNNTAATTSHEQSLTISRSASVGSEVSGSSTYSLGTTITIGGEHEFAIMTASFETEFSSSLEVEKGWVNSEEHSAQKDVTSTVSVELPPYTGVMVKQTEKNQEVITEYNCPVSITYRVRVLEYQYMGKGASRTLSGVLADFEDDSRAHLYKRAVVEKNYTDINGIKWTDFDSDENLKAAVDAMSDSIPMASTPAKFTERLKTIESVVDGLMPINPLRIIQMTEQDDEVELEIGDTLRVDNIALEGLNADKYGYYGFDPDYGKWVLYDEDGEELTDSAIAVLKKNNVTGRETLTATGPGTVYLRYVIDENRYGTWSNPKGYAKNSDLIKSAIIEVIVKDSTTPPEKVKVAVPTGKTLTYNGKTQTGVAAGENYAVTGNKAAKAGSYTAVVTLKDPVNSTWEDGTVTAKEVKWKINKAANPLKIAAKTATVKYSKLKNKNQTLAVSSVINFTKKISDKKTYSIESAKKGSKSFKKYFTISKSTGKVTVKKGLKKGTYTVKIKVKALGNSNYKASAYKYVTSKIKVQ